LVTWHILGNLKKLLPKARAVRFVRKVKLGHNELLTLTPLLMPIWLLLSIAKTLITPKSLKAENGRARNGKIKGLG
jgi:hypothetical protein